MAERDVVDYLKLVDLKRLSIESLFHLFLFCQLKTIMITHIKNKIQEIYQDKNLWIFIFVALGCILFREKIDILINDWLAVPIFQYIPQDALSDTIIIILSFLICNIYLENISEKRWMNKQFGFVIYTIGFIYLIYRFFYQSLFWENYNFSSYYLNHFFYTDIILLILTCHIYNHILTTWNEIKIEYKLTNDPPKNHSIFHLEGNKIDLTNRSAETKKIADEILKIYSTKSFAIGINGKWGSGKTFFVEKIKERLEENEDELIIIDFNPWRSQSPTNIIIDFFETLRHEVTNYTELSKKIKKYTEQLSNIDSKNLIGIYQSILGIDNSLEESYNEINRLIKKTNKKIIIIIDDIDRLDDQEALEVIRIIRNTANFYNTIFLACYDRYYLNELIKKSLTEYGHERFLDKIFQFEVKLAPFNTDLILNQTYEKLAYAVPSKKAEFSELLVLNQTITAFTTTEDQTKSEKREIIQFYIKNFRDIDRFCNSFIYNYSFIEDEVHLDDFLLIEFLRNKHPIIYDSIQSIIKTEADIGELRSYYVLDEPNISDLLTNNKIDSNQSEIIKRTLNLLFNKRKKGFRAINIPANLPIYISNEIGERISVAKYRNARRKGIENLKTFIEEEIKNEKYLEIMLLLENNQKNYESKVDIEIMIESLIYALCFQEGKQSFPFYETFKSRTFKQNIENYYSEDELKKIVIDKVEKYSPNPALSQWLSQTIKDHLYSRGSDYILSIEDAQTSALIALQKHLKEQDGIGMVSNTWNFYTSCIQTIASNSHIFLQESAINALRNFIELNPYSYLEHCIVNYAPGDRHCVLDVWVPQTFGSVDDFEKFLKKLDQDNEAVKKVSDFFDKYQKNNYSPIPC